MKKSELKALLKIIVQETVAAKQKRLEETKGLSGFKKSKDSTEHTEKVADSKDLTGKTEPKEQKEGKKLPVVKKPATPQKVGSLKEMMLQMIRESIEEMARTPGSIGNKYKVQDPSSPTGWVVKGHKTIPDGTPTDAPKNAPSSKGETPSAESPEKASDVTGDEDVGGDEDDDIAPETGSGDVNTKVKIVIDGDTIGVIDFRKLKGGTISGHLAAFLRGNDYVMKPDQAVNAKMEEFSDLYVDDKLPSNATLNLKLGTNSIELGS